ncbi:MAG: phage tail protein [Flavisolibacter sp.]|jgi:microcystin-dependent protein
MFTTPTLANVTVFAGNFAPRGYALCQGQLMPISENTALFSLLGTTFGGDGQSTFALPDLRGRVAVHPGQGTGLTNIELGQTGGVENITLDTTQIPVHNHGFVSASGGPSASTTPGTTDLPQNNFPAPVNGSGNAYSTSPSAAHLGPASFSGNTPPAGGNQPFYIVSPFLCMNYIIALEGIFPSRN